MEPVGLLEEPPHFEWAVGVAEEDCIDPDSAAVHSAEAHFAPPREMRVLRKIPQMLIGQAVSRTRRTLLRADQSISSVLLMPASLAKMPLKRTDSGSLQPLTVSLMPRMTDGVIPKPRVFSSEARNLPYQCRRRTPAPRPARKNAVLRPDKGSGSAFGLALSSYTRIFSVEAAVALRICFTRS
jgi:hypothetical protein